MKKEQKKVSNKALRKILRKVRKSSGISLVVATISLVTTIIAAIVVLYMAGVFMPASEKIIKCMANTFAQETPFTEAIKIGDILADEFTVEVNSGLKDASMDAKFIRALNEVQFAGSVDYNSFEVEMDASLTENDLKIYIPKYLDKTLDYKFDSANTGVLFKLINEETMAEYDEKLMNFYEKSQVFGGRADMTKYLTYLRVWLVTKDFDKADAKAFTMNGESRKCPGYTVTFSKKEMQEGLAIIEKQLMLDGTDSAVARANAFENLSKLVSEMGEVRVTFYLYANKYIAGISVDTDASDYMLTVKGGPKPWNNADITKDGQPLYSLAGEVDGNVEHYVFSQDGEQKYDLSYDPSTALLDIKTADDTALNLKWFNTGDKLTLTLENVIIKGISHEGNATLTVSRGADRIAFAADELDVGNADIFDLIGIVRVISNLKKSGSDADGEEITLCMVGDILTHMRVQYSAARSDGSYNYDAIFAQTKNFLSNHDISIVNQEVIIGGTELGISGYPQFNCPYDMADALVNTGFNVVCHATNHALDKHDKGLLNCINNWRTKYPWMEVLGVHDSQADQDRIHIMNVKGYKIALLNYTYGTNGIPLPAGMPYAVDYLEKNKVIADIKEAEEKADFTVVMPHWGSEYLLSTDSDQKYWTDIFLKNGVDLVIGTHPHVIEPVEVLTDDQGHQMLVYYSLGNYVNSSASDGAGVGNRMIGGIADVKISTSGEKLFISDYSFVPIVTDLRSGTDGIRVYYLQDYTAAQANSSLVCNQDPTFNLDYAINLVKKVVDEKCIWWRSVNDDIE